MTSHHLLPIVLGATVAATIMAGVWGLDRLARSVVIEDRRAHTGDQVAGGHEWLLQTGGVLALLAGFLIFLLMKQRLQLRQAVRKATTDLRASEEQFKSLLAGSVQGVLIHRDGKPLFANQALAGIFGYDNPEAILSLPSIGALKAEGERERLAMYSAARMEHGSAPVRYEFKGKRKDGTHIWLENFVTAVVWNGELAIQSTSIDITKRKNLQIELDYRLAELEMSQMAYERQGAQNVELAEDLDKARNQAAAANRAKSEFLAAMSHELRTPLNAVIGFSEIMKTEAFGPVGSPKYRDYANDIYDAGSHLLSLINDILDLAKVEAGEDELHLEDIEVADAIEAVLRMVRQRAERSRLQFTVEISEDPPLLRADPRKVKQILANLLSNAVKFTPSGKITVKAWWRADGGYVFQVVDTGIGIALEDIPKALSQFGQIDGKINRRYHGTGLGLPLSKALVEMHGGSLDLQSEVGVGTTVTVRFPTGRIVGLPRDIKAVGIADKKAG